MRPTQWENGGYYAQFVLNQSEPDVFALRFNIPHLINTHRGALRLSCGPFPLIIFHILTFRVQSGDGAEGKKEGCVYREKPWGGARETPHENPAERDGLEWDPSV